MHGHDHADHDHAGHGHAGHSHAPEDFGRAFAAGTALNAGLVVLQVVVGLAAHSVALLADAAHNLGDVLGLVFAWWAASLVRRVPSAVRTYGYGRGTILASLANAVTLLVSIGAIAVVAVLRLLHPAPVDGLEVLLTAGLGIAVNGLTAWLFASGRRGELNVRAAFAHMAADAVISAGVMAAAALILLTGWTRLDPLASLAIVCVIGVATWKLLRESMDLAMDAVPAGIGTGEVEAFLRALPGVSEVHDLHIWGLSTTDTALTAHLVHGGADADALIAAACAGARSRFRIGHCTFQIETEAAALGCALRPAEIVLSALPFLRSLP